MIALVPRLSFLSLLAAVAPAQTGTVLGIQKISDTEGGFSGALEPGGRFGLAIASIGDLDGDGIGDLVVGKEGDDDGGADRGAVYVLFLDADGTVGAHRKISDTQGGFGGALANHDRFGASVAPLGDLDGDGRPELAVGAIFDDDGSASSAANRGALWVLSLDPDGTVAAETKISSTAGGFAGPLDDGDWFGISVTSLGDIDGAGPSVAAIAVGALFDDDGGTDRGAVWVLFLDASAQVVAEQKISDLAGGFAGDLDDDDRLGRKVVTVGDLDGDGVVDIAASAPHDDTGGADRGAVWVMFLNADGTSKSAARIASGAGGFQGELSDKDFFGRGLGALGDLDCDGVADLVVGAIGDDDASSGTGNNRGAVWVLFLQSDGSVAAQQKISDVEGGFAGGLDDFDVFGTAAVGVHDVDGDGVQDVAVGVPGDDDGGPDHGGLWLLFLKREGRGLGVPYCCPAVPHSGGTWARISGTGSDVVADDDFTLVAEQMPVGVFGMFLASRVMDRVPNPGGSQGVLCLGGGIGRFPVLSSGVLGRMEVAVDLTDVPLVGVVAPGDRVAFQAWFRDKNPGSTSNFTDGVTVEFQ